MGWGRSAVAGAAMVGAVVAQTPADYASSLWQKAGSGFLTTGAAKPPKLTDQQFADKYLKHTALFPEAGPSRWFDPPLLHRELSEAADEYSRLLIQVAREHAKSSLFSLVRPLRMICENRNLRIVIISKTAAAAEKFTAVIKFQLANNEKIIADYGRFVPDRANPKERDFPWSDNYFTVSRSAAFREATVQAIGRGGQIVSGRYDIVIGDDMEDYESTFTPAARTKTFEWFSRDVIPVVVAGGSAWVIQTPQHEGDLVGQLKKQPLWVYINKAAERPRAGDDIKGEDGTVKEIRWTEPAQAPADGTGAADDRIRRVSAWAEKWPIYYRHCELRKAEMRGAPESKLAELAQTECREKCPVYNAKVGNTNGVGCLTGKRFEVGHVFYRLQYLCDIAALGGDVFKREWFRTFSRDQVTYKGGTWWYYDPKLDKKFRVEIVSGIDPAIAEEGDVADNEHSNFAMLTMGYVRELRRRLFLGLVDTRMDFPTQVRVVNEQYTAWGPRQIGVEEIAYQRALRQQIVKDLRLPFKTFKSVPDKFAKFSSLTPEAEAGNVYVPADLEVAVQQACAYPRGLRDDILDSWWLCEQVIGKKRILEGHGQGETKPPYDGDMEDVEDPELRARLAQEGWTAKDVLRHA